MSEAIRELRLRVTYDSKDADAAAAQSHAQQRANIKATAAEQERADKAYVQAMKAHLAAEKQLEQERIRGVKAAAAAQAKAARESAREQERLHKDLNATLRQSEREAAREREGLNRDLNRLVQSSARDEVKASKDAERAKVASGKAAFREWKTAADQKHREAMLAWREENEAVKDHRNEVADLIKTFAGVSAIKGVASAIGDEFKRANEYVEKTSKEFADVRHAMQQVAALRGQQPSDQFTMKQVEAAGRAGLTPADWTKAQESFLNPAGAQVGDQPGAKMSDKEAEEYQLRVARLTAAKLGGENAGLGMEYAGAILEQSRGKLTPDQAMAKFNPGFEILQRGRIDLRRAMPMMSQVMAHGVSPAEASTLLNVVAPAAPNEEATHVEAAMRAIEKMRVAGKGGQFGVTDKMGTYEAIKAFSRNISGREKALMAQGKTEEEAEVEIARQLKKAGVAAMIQEQRGLIRGMARNGVKLGGFDLYERVGRETKADYDRGAVASFEASDEGQAAKRRAMDALHDARTGLRDQSAKAVREEARNLAKYNGEFERARAEMMYRGAIGMGTGVSGEDQIVNEYALGKLRSEARFKYGITGDKYGPFQAGTGGVGISTEDAKYRSQNNVNEEIRDLLRLIAEGQRKQTEAFIKANPAAVVGAGIMPLVAMPSLNGR